jgi:hypothetical protein
LIICSEHAKLRMYKRAVSMEEIEAILKSPDIQYPSFLRRMVARKRIGSRKGSVINLV